jgi:NDP-sugar pyrophosphorylase family protein
VYLVVVATPSNTALNLEYTDNRFPVDKCPDRLHYAYEVRLVNLTPATAGRQLNRTETGGHTHPNGGGYVGASATVDSTAYVGPNARVLGTADVLNYARIEDYAIVMSNATVRDNAVVSGYAVVTDNAIIRNSAKIRDRAVVTGSCIVENNAMMVDYTHL